jgi:hypothetical protein
MIPVSFQLTVLLKKSENALIGVSILKNKKIDRISIGSIIKGNLNLFHFDSMLIIKSQISHLQWKNDFLTEILNLSELIITLFFR